MSFWLRLCLGLLVLAPSLAVAQSTANLEIPGDGARLSGIGVISGWKCEADGDITVRFDDAGPEDAIPTLYGFPRSDTGTEKVCNDDGNNGFVTYFNWALLDDGPHTAVAYDNGRKFTSSTFEVTTLGEEFVVDANPDPFPLRVLDFPSPGEEAWFEWNEATQHLELVSVASVNICEALEVPIPPPPGPPPPLVLPRHYRVREMKQLIMEISILFGSIPPSMPPLPFVRHLEGLSKWRYGKEGFPALSVLLPTERSRFLARSARRRAEVFSSENGGWTATIRAISPGA